MPYDARAIANLILEGWDADTHLITNKKINKLIYFAHGFCLARFQGPLVVNHIEAWDHGPVVRVAYDAFKRFGFRPISEPATYFDYKLGTDVIARASLRDGELHFINKVMQRFMPLSGDELEAITHEDNSPWSAVWNGGRKFMNRIPDELIASHFIERYDVIRNHS